jgi:DNA polymerase-3 subunit gamma/tau
MALVRLARRPPLLPLDDLLMRVGDLERRLGGAPPTGPAPRGGGGGTRAGGSTRVTGIAEARGAGGSVVGASAPAMRTHGVLALAPAPDRSPAPSPTALQAPVAVVGAAPVAADREALDVWRAIIDRLRRTRPGLASIYEHGIPIDVSAARVVVGFEAGASFLIARASEEEAVEALTREIREHFGAATQVVLDVTVKPASGSRTVAALDADARAAEVEKARLAIEGHPVVKEAMRLFDAKLREVKLPGGEG